MNHVIEGTSGSGKATRAAALDTLNRLTATGQKIAASSAASARQYMEAAEQCTGLRRERHLRSAIACQISSAQMYAIQRECYAIDNLGEARS